MKKILQTLKTNSSDIFTIFALLFVLVIGVINVYFYTKDIIPYWNRPTELIRPIDEFREIRLSK